MRGMNPQNAALMPVKGDSHKSNSEKLWNLEHTWPGRNKNSYGTVSQLEKRLNVQLMQVFPRFEGVMYAEFFKVTKVIYQKCQIAEMFAVTL